MKKSILFASLLACLFGVSNVYADDVVTTWSCGDSKQFKTSGTFEKIRLTWESKSYDLARQSSLPGSLRYKNTDSGYDLVVLGNKAMLFNIKTGSRMADFCQTAEMKAGKLPHLFAEAEPFVQN